MDERQALLAFAALSQETRLRILRMLVVAGPDGMAAGAIAEKAEVSPSNVSFHLKELERAGLTRVRRDSRSIIHSIDPRSTLLLPDSRHDILAELLEAVAADRRGFPRKGSGQPSV